MGTEAGPDSHLRKSTGRGLLRQLGGKAEKYTEGELHVHKGDFPECEIPGREPSWPNLRSDPYGPPGREWDPTGPLD